VQIKCLVYPFLFASGPFIVAFFPIFFEVGLFCTNFLRSDKIFFAIFGVLHPIFLEIGRLLPKKLRSDNYVCTER